MPDFLKALPATFIQGKEVTAGVPATRMQFAAEVIK